MSLRVQAQNGHQSSVCISTLSVCLLLLTTAVEMVVGAKRTPERPQKMFRNYQARPTLS